MGAFASFLKKSGIDVTGSDQNIYPPMSDVLKNAGVTVFTPFDPKNIENVKPDLVIVGNVVRKTNPEMEYVASKNIQYLSLPHALETMILPQKHSIVVAGTHGKTTTSSMMSWILEVLGEKPSFFVGGVVKNFTESFRVTDSKFMVLEGDEYDTAFFDKVPKFTHYLPKDVILTSIEYDHADIYPDMNSVIAAFEKLAAMVPPTGFMITCSEYETTLRVSLKTRASVITYGFGAGAESRATGILLSTSGCTFKWHAPNGRDYKISLPVPGKHNLLNALGCLTLCYARNLDLDKAIHALSTFEGVKRRQEIFGSANSITLIDDFAHHPTAVRETLSAIKNKYPESRIVACFEPRSATSRKKVFQEAYSESFDQADVVYVAKPFQAAGSASQQTSADVFSTEELLSSLQNRGKRAKILTTSDDGVKSLSRELKSGDVVLVMSNGGFDGLLPRLLSLLKAQN